MSEAHSRNPLWRVRRQKNGWKAKAAAKAAEEFRRQREAKERELVRLKVLPHPPSEVLQPSPRQPHRRHKIVQPLPTKEEIRAARIAKKVETGERRAAKKRRPKGKKSQWKHQRPEPLKARPSYADYMQSATWRRVRLWKLERAGWKCERCGAQGRLDVHHLSYDRLGRELLADLQALCRGCHEGCHDAHRAAKDHLAAIMRAE